MPCSACSGWLVCCRSAALSTSDSATARSLDSKISAAACLQSTPTGQQQVAQSTSQTAIPPRSEEHTSELQSRGHLVCRLLLEKKKQAISIVKSRKSCISIV